MYTYSKILLTLRKEENSKTCAKWMNLVEIMLSEISQLQKKKMLCDSICMKIPRVFEGYRVLILQDEKNFGDCLLNSECR